MGKHTWSMEELHCGDYTVVSRFSAIKHSNFSNDELLKLEVGALTRNVNLHRVKSYEIDNSPKVEGALIS